MFTEKESLVVNVHHVICDVLQHNYGEGAASKLKL